MDQGFSGTGSEGIYRSINNGVNWSAVYDTNLNFTGLATIGNKIFAGAFRFVGRPSTGGVFVSSNYGVTWDHADSGLTDHAVNALVASGTNLYAGTNSGAFASTDEGASWRYISTGSPTDSFAVTSLAVSNSSLVVGTTNGVWGYPLSSLVETDRTKYQLSNRRKED